jgi:acetyl-CoA C-acetyltransferase
MAVQTFIAGAGQHTWRDDVEAPHPAAAMARACSLALRDADVDAGELDLIGCVESLSWTYPDLVGAVASELGLDDSVEHLWVPAGGTSPQDMLHQIGTRIAAGELHCAVICGAESMRTRRRLARQDKKPAWPARAADLHPMRGQPRFSSELERRHGLREPIHVFPLFENAIRAAKGRTQEQQTAVAASLLAKNAKVAQRNPHAWFHDAPSREEIATVTPANRMIVFPYTKRMNAIMDVDQCAAILVVSKAWLEERGGSDRAAAVLGGTGVEEIWNPIERNTFATCPAMKRAFDITLDRSGLVADDIDAMDLYSCFPSPIQLGLDALGSGPDDERPVSLTGGLAFAGGPGNAYVLHSLATALTNIRERPESRLLVTGIGMANTKHAATVLAGAGHIPESATGETSYRETLEETPRNLASEAQGRARISTYTIEYDRDGSPSNIILFLDLENGERTVANMADIAQGAAALLAGEPVGAQGTVTYDKASDRNLFAFNR